MQQVTCFRNELDYTSHLQSVADQLLINAHGVESINSMHILPTGRLASCFIVTFFLLCSLREYHPVMSEDVRVDHLFSIMLHTMLFFLQDVAPRPRVSISHLSYSHASQHLRDIPHHSKHRGTRGVDAARLLHSYQAIPSPSVRINSRNNHVMKAITSTSPRSSSRYNAPATQDDMDTEW